MRICSLLPSATEIAYAIGLGDSILGVSHECDFPAEAATKPSLLRPRVDPQAPPAEIDRQVSEIIARGESIYAVDAELLASLSPDLILHAGFVPRLRGVAGRSRDRSYTISEGAAGSLAHAAFVGRSLGRRAARG